MRPAGLEVRKRLPAPKAACFVQRHGRELGVSVRPGPPPLREQLLEALQVKLARLYLT